jgi:hypothetical protein
LPERAGVEGSSMQDPSLSGVWWAYLGRGYRDCYTRGTFSVSGGRTARWIPQVRKGDLIVHEYFRSIVAVSRVEKVSRSEDGEGAGWIVEAEFHRLKHPVKFRDIRESLLAAEPPQGPVHFPDGSGKPGDLYPFNHSALKVVLGATRTTLPW